MRHQRSTTKPVIEPFLTGTWPTLAPACFPRFPHPWPGPASLLQLPAQSRNIAASPHHTGTANGIAQTWSSRCQSTSHGVLTWSLSISLLGNCPVTSRLPAAVKFDCLPLEYEHNLAPPPELLSDCLLPMSLAAGVSATAHCLVTMTSRGDVICFLCPDLTHPSSNIIIDERGTVNKRQ